MTYSADMIVEQLFHRAKRDGRVDGKYGGPLDLSGEWAGSMTSFELFKRLGDGIIFNRADGLNILHHRGMEGLVERVYGFQGDVVSEYAEAYYSSWAKRQVELMTS